MSHPFQADPSRPLDTELVHQDSEDRIPKAPWHAFHSTRRLDKNLDLRVAACVREDFVNCTAPEVGARKMLVAEAEINGQYGLLVLHNGLCFPNVGVLRDALRFNTSAGTSGIQGGGMKAGTTVLPPAIPNTFSIHIFSKDGNGSGFSRTTSFKKPDYEGGESTVTEDESSILTIDSVKAVLGNEYDDWNVVIFRPMGRPTSKKGRTITGHFLDKLGTLVDGLDARGCETTAIIRKPNKTGKGYGSVISTTTPVSSVSGKGERVPLITRMDKYAHIIPTVYDGTFKEKVVLTTQISDTLEECHFTVTGHLILGAELHRNDYRFERMWSKQREITNPDQLEHENYLWTGHVASAKLDSRVRHAPKMDRMFDSPMNVNECILGAFLNGVGIYSLDNDVVKVNEPDRIQRIWEACESNDGAFKGASLDNHKVECCLPSINASFSIKLENEGAKAYLPPMDFDVNFLVSNDKVRRILAKAFDQAKTNENEDFVLFGVALRDLFMKPSSGLVELTTPLSSDRKARDEKRLIAYSPKDKQTPIVRTFFENGDDDTTPIEVLLKDEDGDWFTKEIGSGTWAPGFEIMQARKAPGGWRKITVAMDHDKDESERVKRLRFQDTDGKKYLVQGIEIFKETTERETLIQDPDADREPKPGEQTDGNQAGDQKKRHPDLYVYLKESVTGIVRNGILYPNGSDPLVKEIFEPGDGGLQPKQQDAYERMSKRVIAKYTRMESRFKVEFEEGKEPSEEERSPSSTVTDLDYLFDEVVLRDLMEEEKEAILSSRTIKTGNKGE